MYRPGSPSMWLAFGLLAALAGCGGGSPDRGPVDPPHLIPDPYLSFFHPVSRRTLPSGATFDVPQSLRPGVAMTPYALPAAESMPVAESTPDSESMPDTESMPESVQITYEIEPRDLPSGLAFNPATRILSGRLASGAEHPPSYRLRYRASAPDHRDAHLSIILHLPPTFGADGFGTVSFPIDRSTETMLPAATGGRPPYEYRLTGCAIPSWLRIDGRTLHGSPTAANQHERERHCEWRVTDSLGGVDSFFVSISVDAGPEPRLYFPSADGTPLEDGAPLPTLGTIVQGKPVPSLPVFPEASGTRTGARIDYGLEVADGPPGVHTPPNGLDLDPVRRSLSGTIDDPRWPAGAYRLYYVASAPGHVDARLTVSFDLEDPLRLRAATAPSEVVEVLPFPVGGFELRPLPQAAGGTLPYRYSLEQCPLDWLEVVGEKLAGNPQPEHAGTERLCRYRVTDAAGAFVELTLRVSAVAEGTPLQLEESDILPETGASLSFPVGEFTRPPSLPKATGGSPPYRYSLEQCPLDWLELVDRELAANPQREHAGDARLCRYRATDATGAFVERLFQVSVGEGSKLHFATVVECPGSEGDKLRFQVNKFGRCSLPEAIGGIEPYRYSLEQCPLDWIKLIGTELAASPGPEHVGEGRFCGYRVTDAEENIADLVLEISATPVPIDVFQFENRHIVDRDLPVGSAIEPIILPRAIKGKWRYNYELRPLPPEGLEFVEPRVESEHPLIRGTPTAISLLTRYCIHATDDGGATAAPRCFRLRTVGQSVPRFTVNLGSVREVLLYSTLTSTTVHNDPYDIGRTEPEELVDVPIQLPVAFLPPSWLGNATYPIVPNLSPFRYNRNTRVLTSPVIGEEGAQDHPVPSPVVYTYGVRRVGASTLFAAAICFELGHRIETRTVTVADNQERVWRDTWLTLTFHDEAVRTSTGEYLCHPNPRGDDDPGDDPNAQSNPVHDALSMVHARRAVRLAHDLIGERVRDRSPGGEGVELHSHADLGRLWGRSGGFSWSGTGESLLAGADVVRPGGALRLGLVAGFHRTALDYRAEAPHLEGRYTEGEHVTEIVSAHPFAAWRFATGSVAWGSVGAGAGSLRFEDDAPPFDERRPSDLALGSAALGFRHPLTSSRLGELGFSGLAEHVALRIEGDEAPNGIRPRRLRGSNLALGLDWHRRPADAETSLVPSFSLGVRRETGDGAADSLVDVAGSLAYRPASKPLSFDVAASTLLGVTGSDTRAWDVRASARLDPSPGPRGLELSLRSALGASSVDAEPTYGLDGELAYGVFGGAFGSTVRPYVGVSGIAGAGGMRRAAGLRLRDQPDYRLSLETHEHAGTDAAGLTVRLHRYWP